MARYGDISYQSRYGPKNKRAFTPYDPTVPAGSYDPGLDSALGAAGRGLQDLTGDTQTAQQRGLIDYGLQRDQTQLAQTRGDQDYQSNLGLLTRKYDNLAGRQAEQQAAYGVTSGGAMLQAAAKRKANQALEKAPLDQANTRLHEDVQNQLGQLGLGYQRGVDDSGLALLRGQREAGQFGIDTQGQRLFQASQAGYVAPTKPANEFTNAAGVPYRTIKTKAGTIRVDQFGRRI